MANRHIDQAVKVIAEALRDYQRIPGVLNPGQGTLWIDHAEEPARVMVGALKNAGYQIKHPDGSWL